jgi:Protein of unknown function (DUF1553)/Protein of unknown function (DUF1549)/Planctomycete cytochrome C/Concanavalin A-like lectin/glucanases superfamily
MARKKDLPQPRSLHWASSLGMATALLLAIAGCRSNHSGSAAVQSGQHLDFNQDVQPILAGNCFSCHGPDPAARKAGLRLDLEESAFRKRPGKPDAIVPGHPEQSEMIKRIEAKDPHRLMPQDPRGAAKPMKPEEIAVLRRWIADGAHYKPHWAFDKPLRAALPRVQPVQPKNSNPDMASANLTNPIDNFILARLAKEGLHPSPEADKRTLIRRVSLDLTGLLPTHQEVDTYLRDNSPQSYERLVDRLLATPSYGEQRARYWLDYVRYADTYGLHYDNNRHIWPYRDYLIRAFNSNKPFDQFAREQIAGDLLPAKNVDAIIASGYVRSGVSSNEGGAIPEELRFNIARERAEAYGGAFLGLTVGCAVCHDHKYDPTTQKDFYQLTAFFNNLNEQPFNNDKPDWAPVMRVPKPQNLDAYNHVLQQRSVLQIKLDAARLQERSLIEHWLASRQNPAQPVSSDKLLLRLRLDEGGGDVLKNSAPNASPSVFPIGKSKPQWGETTLAWPDFRLDTGTRIMLGQTGDFEWNHPFSLGGWFMMRSAPNFGDASVTGALISKMDTTQQNRGWDLTTEKGILSVEIVNSTPKKQLKISTLKPLSHNGQWQHIFLAYDGSGKAAGIKLYVNGALVATKVASDTLAHETIRTTAPMQLGWRYPDAQPARETRYQDLRLYSRAVTGEEVRRLPTEDYVAEITSRTPDQWNKDQWQAVSQFYFDHVDAEAKAMQGQIEQLNAQLDKLSQGGDLTLVSEEKQSIAYANVLTRGIYSARQERLEADTPHFLPALPAGKPHNRLALAEWTVSPENPLTARVTVNRMWNEIFGAGLVETTEDFGIMGQRPSNPQLLDWLAVEFPESGWDMKHMYKLMVMSAAYRQSAKSTPEQLAKDPRNLLLARGPRFRMDAEMLRDIALQSSGLLVNKIGGPSVKPYQPDNVWESVGYPTSDTTKYKQDHGEALYRRSLYTYWKRMAMPPDMDAFDAPTRDTVCTRRQRTDTPLQALVTMNDTQWIEASRALAERLIKEGGQQPAQRIQYLSELVLARDPSPQMQSVLQKSFDQMQRHYEADPKAARDLIAVGEKRSDPTIPATQLAAWTMVASEMLNLDETLNK